MLGYSEEICAFDKRKVLSSFSFSNLFKFITK